MKCAAAAVALFTAAMSAGTFALDDTLDASQYAHAAWRTREGFPRSPVRAFAQTPDGYLWLGTDEGLVRFDGVQGVLWPPPPHRIRIDRIRTLYAARDGALWLGMLDGVAVLRGTTMKRLEQFTRHIINTILEGPDGTLWVGTQFDGSPRLCAVRDSAVRCEDVSRFGGFIMSLCADGKGTVWAAMTNGLLRVHPGPFELHASPLPLQGSLQGLVRAPDGTLLALARQGIVRYTEGRAELTNLVWARDENAVASRLLADRDGGIWLSTSRDGLAHIHRGRTDGFTIADGLTSDSAGALFEDREGNVWVATIGGLDRFSAQAMAPIGLRQGLSTNGLGAVVAARDGSIWFSARDFVNRWRDGDMTVYRGPDAPRGLASLFEDSRGRIWVGALAKVGHFDGDRFVTVNDIPGGYVDGFAEDKAGNLWATVRQHGLFRRSPDGTVVRVRVEGAIATDAPSRIVADPHAGVWLGFREGGVAHVVDERVVFSHGRGVGLAQGYVRALHVQRDGTVWFGTPNGLHRLKNGRDSTMGPANGLPCEYIDWLNEDVQGEFWLYSACGLIRISREDREAWSAAADRGEAEGRPVRYTLLDIADGVLGAADMGSYSPHAAQSADARLWFGMSTGMVLDPARMRRNPVPPPVHIERIVADRQVLTADEGRPLELPALVRDLQIDYTALSFTAPEKMKFRHRLEGRDAEWQDVGTRRQAFYTDLPPGDYRFRVIAANNSGVWNETGATLAFSIPPVYYQTTWFRAGLAATALLLAWALHLLRLRRLKMQFEIRVTERVAERTRIARELHDTLLQTFQGTLLNFHTATSLLPERPEEAKRRLEGVIDQAAQAIADGRDAVQGLRASTTLSNDLAEDLARLAEEAQLDEAAPELRTHVKGDTRELVPLVRDEVHRVAREAVRNAFRHSGARHIEVLIQYERRRLTLRIRDDGAGIPGEILAAGGRDGHFGLAGMKERAQLVGGTLAVHSGPGLGTEVVLQVPAAHAYARHGHAGARHDERTKRPQAR